MENLQNQIAQRGNNVDRVNSLMNSNKQEFFNDWKGKADNLYNKKLSNYSAKLQSSVARQVGESEQGATFLATAPIAYQAGTMGYNLAPKVIQGGLDDLFSSGKAYTDLAGQKLEGAIETGKSLGRDVVGKATQQLENFYGNPETTIRTPLETDPEDLVGLQATEAPVSSGGYISNSIVNTGNAPSSTLAELSNNAENLETTTANVATNTTSADTSAVSGETIGEDIGGVITEDAAIDEVGAGLAETGIGAPIAGALVVGATLITGLEDIFNSSKHDNTPAPKVPSLPPAMTNRYSLSSSILPNVSSLSTTPTNSIF